MYCHQLVQANVGMVFLIAYVYLSYCVRIIFLYNHSYNFFAE